MQGWRPTQEDAHIALSPDWCRNLCGSGWNAAGLFGVLDGHGGPEVAQLVKRWLPVELVVQSSDSKPHAPSSALKKAFHKVDERIGTPDGRKELRNLGAKLGKEATGGCAAAVCAVDKEAVTVANVGGCRAVLCRAGGEAVLLTKDHTADLPQERLRIVAAGGWVDPKETPWGATKHRVNGVLNLSRSLGDMKFKKDPALRPSEQIISGVPDVNVAKRESGDEFLILASDGVWEVRSEQFVVDFIRNGIRKNGGGPDGVSKVLEALLDSCVSPHPEKTRGLGCDNMTAVLVRFAATNAEDAVGRKRSVNEQAELAGDTEKKLFTELTDEGMHKSAAPEETQKKRKRRRKHKTSDKENANQENQEQENNTDKRQSPDFSGCASVTNRVGFEGQALMRAKADNKKAHDEKRMRMQERREEELQEALAEAVGASLMTLR